MASNISAVWTPHWQETLIGGVLQGRKQLDPRAASRICRRGLWGEGVRVAGLVGAAAAAVTTTTLLSSQKSLYKELKQSNMLTARHRVKADVKGVLKGWLSNVGDDEWHL